MKLVSRKTCYLLGSSLLLSLFFISCKDNGDVTLPPIAGYNNSNEVAQNNNIAYFALDGNGTEAKSSTAATSVVNVTWVPGVKGQAAQFNNGYIYTASPLAVLPNAQSFSVSAWVQATNNKGGTPPVNDRPFQYFQIARPGQLWGNFNGLLQTDQYTAASDTLVFKSLYADASGGLQDNINNYGVAGTEYKVVKKAGTGQWAHVVTTYETNGSTVNLFKIYVDSVLVSNVNFQSRGVNTFKFTSPNQIMIGGWLSNLPGSTITPETWAQPFIGKIDEIRVYNKLLTMSEIAALYRLGLAGR
jgi:hypothetical protein